MSDYTKSSEYIVRDVYSSVNTTSAETYSTEDIVRGCYDAGSSVLIVKYNSGENVLKVKNV